MRIGLHTGLNLKTYYSPLVKATAQQLAEAGEVIWRHTNPQKSTPKRYRNGKKLAKLVNREKGFMFQKKLGGDFVLTPNGKRWLEGELFMHYLSPQATLGTFMKTIISKINHLKKYPGNIYKAPF